MHTPFDPSRLWKRGRRALIAGFGAWAITASGCGGDVSTGGSTTGGSTTSGSTTSGSTGTGGHDGSCTTEQACPDNELCLFAQASCAPGAKGGCQGGYTCDGPATGPLCGCDGVVVEGEMAVCTQWSKGAPYDDPGPCQTGTFLCGKIECKRNAEICKTTIPGMPGPFAYECVPFDTVKGTCSHGIPDCSCMDVQPIGATSPMCTSDADHQETVTLALP